MLIRGVRRGRALLPTIFWKRTTFLGARIESVTDFSRSRFADNVVFNRVQVHGAASFQRALFCRHVSFMGAHFQSILFRDPPGQQSAAIAAVRFRDSVGLRDCTYERISVVDWKGFLKKTKPFDRQPYNQLEKVLRLAGNDQEAGDVYYRRRVRELHERVSRVFLRDKSQQVASRHRVRAIPRLVFDLIQLIVFRFGVRPLRLAGMSMAMVFLGALVFSQPGAVTHKEQKGSKYLAELVELRDKLTPEERPQIERAIRDVQRNFITEALTPGEAFGYSVRLFIPIVEIPFGGDWVPSAHPVRGLGIRAEIYAGLHRLTGAILVPLGVAALTGLLVRRDRA